MECLFRECSIDGCTNAVRARGVCNNHYHRQRRAGAFTAPPHAHKAVGHTQICPACSREFQVPPRRNYVTCSKRCAVKWRMSQQPSRKARLQCRHCGTWFERYTNQVSLYTACSRKCVYALRMAAAQLDPTVHPKYGKASGHGKVTLYKGQRYRSTYEARFARYLDEHGIGFEYEPERFSLSTHETYVPDFWVQAWNAFVEIKGWLGFARTQKVRQFRIDYPNRAILLFNGRHLNALYGLQLKGVG